MNTVYNLTEIEGKTVTKVLQYKGALAIHFDCHRPLLLMPDSRGNFEFINWQCEILDKEALKELGINNV